MRVRYASRIVTRVLTLLVMSELPDLRLDFIKDGKGDVTGLTIKHWSDRLGVEKDATARTNPLRTLRVKETNPC